MIRIDEIYNNVFLAALQEQKATALHWFEPFGTTEFENICNLPKVDGIAAKRIVFWDQEPLHRDRVSKFFDQFNPIYYGPKTLVTSEYASENVRWACDTYGLEPAYYFFHGWAALDWYRGYNHTFLSKPFKERRPDVTFLCPNNIIGGQRKHRLELLSELVDRELVYTNLVSFPDRCPYENQTVVELCQEYNIHMASVELPLVIDQGVNYHSNSHQVDMWALANRSLLHVVTETVYTGQRQHLTEKTFKPIVMQQPFVLVSCQHSLEYLRRYGFKTFGEFWDESYDDAIDGTRILKIGKLLADLDSMSTQEKRQLQKHLVPVVEYNYRWFYSAKYEQLLWNELQGMINDNLLRR